MFSIVQSLPMGVPDERLKLRVTIDQKFRENIRLSQVSCDWLTRGHVTSTLTLIGCCRRWRCAGLS